MFIWAMKYALLSQIIFFVQSRTFCGNLLVSKMCLQQVFTLSHVWQAEGHYYGLIIYLRCLKVLYINIFYFYYTWSLPVLFQLYWTTIARLWLFSIVLFSTVFVLWPQPICIRSTQLVMFNEIPVFLADIYEYN